MRANRNVRSRGGITLFEAVAAMAIVGLTAVAALEAVGSQMRTAERARRALEVQALAAQRLDWVDFLDEQRLRAIPDSVEHGEFDKPFGDYRWKMETAPVSTQPGLWNVRITITWPGNSYEIRSQAYRQPMIASRGARR